MEAKISLGSWITGSLFSKGTYRVFELKTYSIKGICMFDNWSLDLHKSSIPVLSSEGWQNFTSNSIFLFKISSSPDYLNWMKVLKICKVNLSLFRNYNLHQNVLYLKIFICYFIWNLLQVNLCPNQSCPGSDSNDF